MFGYLRQQKALPNVYDLKSPLTNLKVPERCHASVLNVSSYWTLRIHGGLGILLFTWRVRKLRVTKVTASNYSRCYRLQIL